MTQLVVSQNKANDAVFNYLVNSLDKESKLNYKRAIKAYAALTDKTPEETVYDTTIQIRKMIMVKDVEIRKLKKRLEQRNEKQQAK